MLTGVHEGLAHATMTGQGSHDRGNFHEIGTSTYDVENVHDSFCLTLIMFDFLGLDHRVGHFRPLRIMGVTPNLHVLNGLEASTWDRSSWGGRRRDQGLKRFPGIAGGLDHRVGHFRPLRIMGVTPNVHVLNGLEASTWDRSSWGGRRRDQGLAG